MGTCLLSIIIIIIAYIRNVKKVDLFFNNPVVGSINTCLESNFTAFLYLSSYYLVLPIQTLCRPNHALGYKNYFIAFCIF